MISRIVPAFHVPNSKFDGVVYGTTQYMKLPIMIDTTIDDVTLAVDNCTDTTLSLPYLARNYTTVEDRHIWIPVVSRAWHDMPHC